MPIRFALVSCLLTIVLTTAPVAGHEPPESRRAVLERQLAAQPTADGFRALAALLLATDEPAAALPAIAQAKALAPDTPGLDLLAARALRRLNRPAAALKRLESAEANARTELCRARCLLALDQPDAGRQAFDRALLRLESPRPELILERAAATDDPAARQALLQRAVDQLGPVPALLAAMPSAAEAGDYVSRTAHASLAALHPPAMHTPEIKPPRTPLPQPTLRRIPYLQLAGPERITICWGTDVNTRSQVRFGTDPEQLNRVVTGTAWRRDHALHLEELSPDTTYWYTVGSPTGALGSPVSFRTAPETGASATTRIWILGDSGTADDAARRVRDAARQSFAAQPPDLWLMLGDNAYADGKQSEYQKAVFDMYQHELPRTPLWSTLGNHDGHTADSMTQSGPYYDIFHLPTRGELGGVPSGTEAYYSFDWANIHFVCLDSHQSIHHQSDAMMQWLEADLAASSQTWTIAFWHHPPYSRGCHDSDDPKDSRGCLTKMRERAVPRLEAGGVDLVLSGHSHSYERSQLINGHYGTSNTLRDTMVLDGGDGRIGSDGAYAKPAGDAAHRGAVYSVAGSSGKISGGTFDHPIMEVGLNVLGSMIIDVEGSTLRVQFIDDAGAVRDRFTMTKPAAAVAVPAAPLTDDGK